MPYSLGRQPVGLGRRGTHAAHGHGGAAGSGAGALALPRAPLRGPRAAGARARCAAGAAAAGPRAGRLPRGVGGGHARGPLEHRGGLPLPHEGAHHRSGGAGGRVESETAPAARGRAGTPLRPPGGQLGAGLRPVKRAVVARGAAGDLQAVVRAVPGGAAAPVGPLDRFGAQSDGRRLSPLHARPPPPAQGFAGVSGAPPCTP